MHEKNIEYIRKEVLRLIEKQQGLVKDLIETPNLLKDKQEDNHDRTIDRKEAELWAKTLYDENSKVERLEMTLAVVGTVKAGKSTTINAIF